MIKSVICIGAVGVGLAGVALATYYRNKYKESQRMMDEFIMQSEEFQKMCEEVAAEMINRSADMFDK